jgi:DNA-binding GntR family transcriptional regulator
MKRRCLYHIEIDKRCKTSIELQLRDRLIECITNSHPLESCVLPSVDDLADGLNVSREIIVKAYEHLVQDHIISKVEQQYFVNSERSFPQFKNITDIADYIRLSGYEPSYRLISLQTCQHSDIPPLTVQPPIGVYHVAERLHMGDGRPFFYSISYIPINLVSHLQFCDIEHYPVFKYIKETYNKEVKKFDIYIQSKFTSDHICQFINDSPKLSRLVYEAYAYEASGQILSYSVIVAKSSLGLSYDFGGKNLLSMFV